jgi:hypothetical protein
MLISSYSVDAETTDSDSEITQFPVCPGNAFTTGFINTVIAITHTTERAGTARVALMLDCSWQLILKAPI